MPTIKKQVIGRHELEIDIQRAIMHAINGTDFARVERNNKWSGHVVREDGQRVFVEAGLSDGSADLIGHVRAAPLARALYLEVKRPGERQLASQVAWMQKVRYMGAFYAVVTSVDEALAAVERCRRGETS